jgi:hypothetical protein
MIDNENESHLGPAAPGPPNSHGKLKALPAKASDIEWNFEEVEEKDIEMAEA